MRGGVEFGGGNDATFKDGGSRWGIKGSNEISDGLTAVYRFEHKISTGDASQPGGRLAYAGLSGGFGTISLGQVWSASYNHVGSITDGSWFYGNSHTSYRVGNALSYAISAGALSMQVDAIMGGADTDSALDQFEVGVSFDIGDIGKVALAHVNKKNKVSSMQYHMTDETTGSGATEETTTHMDLKPKKALTPIANIDDDGNLIAGDSNANINAIIKAADGSYSSGDISACNNENDVETDDCGEATFYSRSVTTNTAPDAAEDGYSQNVTPITTEYFFAAADVKTATLTKVVEHGSKATHFAIQASLGPVTGYLGSSQKKTNGSKGKEKVTHYGVSGGLGDTGVNLYAMGRQVKEANGKKTSPWLIGVTKGLGGGATAMLEHGNDDDGNSGKTRVGLKVDF